MDACASFTIAVSADTLAEGAVTELRRVADKARMQCRFVPLSDGSS